MAVIEGTLRRQLTASLRQHGDLERGPVPVLPKTQPTMGLHSRDNMNPPQKMSPVTFRTGSERFLPSRLVVALGTLPKLYGGSPAGQNYAAHRHTRSKWVIRLKAGSCTMFKFFPASRLRATPRQPTPLLASYHIKICLLLLHPMYVGLPARPSAAMHTQRSRLHCTEPSLPQIKFRLQHQEELNFRSLLQPAPSLKTQNTSQMACFSAEGLQQYYTPRQTRWMAMDRGHWLPPDWVGKWIFSNDL